MAGILETGAAEIVEWLCQIFAGAVEPCECRADSTTLRRLLSRWRIVRQFVHIVVLDRFVAQRIARQHVMD